MSSELAIRVLDLGKRYRLGGHEPYRRLGETIFKALRRPFSKEERKDREIRWAIRHVTFDVARGEVLGIIGENGAGKTTLLRILAHITHPSEGRAEIYGKVGSLLEVGTGFHPELNGRENVYLNGAILGMSRTEINRKYDEIVDFAQIDSFMETPVKHYSTGMRVRLAFSVAAHLDPEILFIDEVLSVGDASFQARCLKKMEEVAGAGRTVLFVSHNLGAVVGLCTRCILMEHGKIRMDGEPQEVVESYLSTGYASQARWQHPDDTECGTDLRISSIEVIDEHGRPDSNVAFDSPVRLRVRFEARKRMEGLQILLRVSDTGGTAVLSSSDQDSNPGTGTWDTGRYTYVCEIPGPLLRPGRYLVSAVAMERRLLHEDHPFVVAFDVLPGVSRVRQGLIVPRLQWTLEPATERVATQ